LLGGCGAVSGEADLNNSFKTTFEETKEGEDDKQACRQVNR
jgi:hypothetical protein